MSIPPTVSEDGTVWNFHQSGHEPVPIKLFDANGDQVDLTSAEGGAVFKVKGSLTWGCPVDPDDPLGLIVQLDADRIEMIPPRGAPFAIVTGTGRVLLEGTAYRRGFR